jgi:hypothetical protein
MSPAIKAKLDNPTAAWNLSVASALRAADRAAHAASVAAAWSSRSGVAEMYAAEAARTALMARVAASRAANATNFDEMRTEAALAAEALELTLEADKRVTAAITEQLWAA